MNKILTFAKAVINNINAPEISNEDYEKRLKICLDCEHYDNANDMCKLCGCSCQGKRFYFAKLKMVKESCPINKWGPV